TNDYLFFPFFRISIGFFCAIHLLAILADFDLLFTSDGLIPLEIFSVMKTQLIPSFGFISKYFTNIGISGDIVNNCYIAIYFICCLALIIGFCTRTFAICLLFLHIIIFQSSTPYMYGVDFFKSISLFYCVVFPVGNLFSIDQRIFKRPLINPSPYRNLLKIHLCIVYFTSGLDKAFGINWWNGESIWKALHLPGFKSYLIGGYDIFINYPFLPLFVGISTVLLEMLYPIGINIVRIRPYWLAATIAMHAGIVIAMNLYFFGALMILLNLCAFAPLKNSENVQSTVH